ncbi:MAG: S-layer homology domain-containing protein [Hyphomonadaceae bacterium]|nr:S-layer homology domain-containing protein [Clostridia bacterium]
MNRRILCILLTLCMVLQGIPAFAYPDVPSDAGYHQAVVRLGVLGVIKGYDDGNFHPNDNVTRAQLAKMAVLCSEVRDQAVALAGASAFSDVASSHWASGYIAVAAKQSILNGYGDGNFMPDKTVTYAEGVTILMKLLGYSQQSLGGIWPLNFMQKAKEIGLVKGLSFSASDAVHRDAAALMLDRTLLSNVVKQAATEADKTYLEKTGLGTVKDCAIMGLSDNNPNAENVVVWTDIGALQNALVPLNTYVGKKVQLLLTSDNQVLLMKNADKIEKFQMKEVVIIGTPETDKTVMLDRVKTDVGEFKTPGRSLNTFLGQRVQLVVNSDNEVLDISVKNPQTLIKFTVEGVVLTQVKTTAGHNYDLPDLLPLYNKGVKSTFGALKATLTQGYDVILAKSGQDNYEYGIILEPDWLGPIVAQNDVHETDTQVEGIDIANRNNVQVFKEGKIVTAETIQKYDVLYTLKNDQATTRKIYVYSDKVSGTYQVALPNKSFVNKVTVSEQTVEVGTQTAAAKLGDAQNAYKTDDHVTLLIGKDGRVVDVVDVYHENTQAYAVVLKAWQDIATDEVNKGKIVYHIKLGHFDGTTAEYIADKSYLGYKGNAVQYGWQDGKMHVEFVTRVTVEGTVDALKRMIGDKWISPDVKILELVSNKKDQDAVVQAIDFEDLRITHMPKESVLHAVLGGAFDDVQMLLVEDVSNKSYRYGILEEANLKSNSYKILENGKVTTFQSAIGFGIVKRTPIAFKMDGTSIAGMSPLKATQLNGKINALDTSRIKINQQTYWLEQNVQVYKTSVWDSTLVPTAMSELTNKTYHNITLYGLTAVTDGGKASVIVIYE